MVPYTEAANNPHTNWIKSGEAECKAPEEESEVGSFRHNTLPQPLFFASPAFA